MKSYNILYIGPLQPGSTCLARMNALKALGHHVHGIDTRPAHLHRTETSLLYRISGMLFRLGVSFFGPKDLAKVNIAISNYAGHNSIDILWLDKALVVDRHTLRDIKTSRPHCTIIGYSPDDMFARHNQSPQFLKHISLYDIYFTTKSYGVDEIKSLGCKRVAFVGNAFDPYLHKPMPVSHTDRVSLGGEVGFIGNYEYDRAINMLFLANHSIKVRVWGPNWDRCKFRSDNLILENKCLWDKDYALALSAFDINLCFLNKQNRDLQTTRSVEIPACGGFMLAERTKEHESLFVEGKEADFFSNKDELLEKVRYYLDHPTDRARIALSGHDRCVRDGYSNIDRLRDMLEQVESIPVV